MANLQIYKKGQGKNTRILTFAGAMLLVGIGAWTLSNTLDGFGPTRRPVMRYGIPTVIVIVAGMLMFWIVNRPKTADFLIATESEMKKVSWSSKKEIIGSTKVVIVFAFIMMSLLFAVDVLFVQFFRWTKVMG